MENFVIQIQENLESEILLLIREYWEFENNIFVNKPTVIANKHNLSLQDLNNLVKKYSKCVIYYDHCQDCGDERTKEVFSQTACKGNRANSKTRCSDCEAEYWKNIEEERVAFQESQQQERFEDAVINKKWLELTDEEFGALRGIITCQTKKAVYENVFNGNPWDKSIWRIVNKLEKLGLISVPRSEFDNTSVKGFDFDYRLIDLIGQNFDAKTLDTLSFSLSKYHKKQTAKQPDYSGTFTLKSDVLIQAGVKYIYGGWVNTDGSINLKFQPESSLRQVKQTDIDDEPKHIKDVVDSFFDELEEKDNPF